MMFQETYNQFVKDVRSSILKVIDTGSDLLLHPVPDNVISKVRGPFKLHIDEKVLYVRDTGFWDSGDQGLVMTDWGITIVPDNEKPDDIYQYAWVDIEYAEYSGQSIFLFRSSNRNDHFEIPINFFLKYYDDNEACQTYGEIIAQILTNMAATQTGDNAEKALERMKAAETAEQQIEEANTALSLSSEEDVVWQAKVYQAYAYKQIALSHGWDQDTPEKEKNEAIALRLKNLKIADDLFLELEQMHGTQDWINVERGDLRCQGTDFANYGFARRLFISAMKSEDNDTKKTASDNYDWVTQQLFHLYDYYEKELQADLVECETEEDKQFFMEIAEESKFSNDVPYRDRQFLLLARNKQQIGGYYDPEDNIKWVFTLDQIPKDLVFEGGVPAANTLYIAHPVKTNTYLQYENAEERLFMEKVREFCYLAQCLGATEVTFKSIKGLSVSQETNFIQNATGRVESWVADVDGQYNGSSNSKSHYSNNAEVGLRQTFRPTSAPYCPNGLVWFDSDSEWKLLVKQRMDGNMLTYHYRIKSNETCNISTNQIHDVKASFENMLVKANANYNAKTDTTFSKHEETEWEISVQFAPISELKNASSNQLPSNQSSLSAPENTSLQLNAEEQEYVDTLKECLSNDGVISDKERRLLDKIRKLNGISEARAQQLEDSLSPKLTEEEQEYLEEYRAVMEDGQVSEKERRLLEKIRKINGISESRARELERMA